MKEHEILANRKKIWEFTCSIKDAILTTSYDWHELYQLCVVEGFDPMSRLLEKNQIAPFDHSLFISVHHICHEQNAISERITCELDSKYHEIIRCISRLPHEQIIQLTNVDSIESIKQLPALLWAIAEDPRRCLRSVEHHFVQRINLEATYALTFELRTIDILKERVAFLEDEVVSMKRQAKHGGHCLKKRPMENTEELS